LGADLGADGNDVHAAEVGKGTREVLGFWFDLVMPEQWFKKSPSLDEEIRSLFGPLRDQLVASEAAGWRDDPETMLAAIIVIDQFSRNLHRGSAEAFAGDPLALALTLEALEKGWDKGMAPERRQFLYMPLMHAEDRAMQRLSCERFEALGNPLNLKFAIDHAEVIEKFGRFPSRNAALGRVSTDEEKVYLSQPGAGW
jgi:uncharacterized protein (DUF924 family)